MRANRTLRFAALCALASFALDAPAARAKDEPPILIIFDGSGSMWGGLEAERTIKLAAAREALQALLPRIAPGTRVGLASFGHRRKGDCSDAEVIVRPDVNTLEQIRAALTQLNPKGKGPLTLALKEAANAIGAESGGTIILIHDGPDNC